MKALISPNEVSSYTWISSWVKNPQTDVWEPVYSTIDGCVRVAQVEPDDKIFGVAEPLYWTNCPEDCVEDFWYFKDNQILPKPQNVPKPQVL
jgi:hypothetical protein